MTETNVETVETAEINIFARTSADGGFEAHIKLVGVPTSKAVKRLSELAQALAAAGMTASTRNGNQNGNGNHAGPACPEHGPAKVKPSQHEPGGFFCSARLGDRYCKWTYSPAKGSTA